MHGCYSLIEAWFVIFTRSLCGLCALCPSVESWERGARSEIQGFAQRTRRTQRTLNCLKTGCCDENETSAQSITDVACCFRPFEKSLRSSRSLREFESWERGARSEIQGFAQRTRRTQRTLNCLKTGCCDENETSAQSITDVAMLFASIREFFATLARFARAWKAGRRERGGRKAEKLKRRTASAGALEIAWRWPPQDIGAAIPFSSHPEILCILGGLCASILSDPGFAQRTPGTPRKKLEAGVQRSERLKVLCDFFVLCAVAGDRGRRTGATSLFWSSISPHVLHVSPGRIVRPCRARETDPRSPGRTSARHGNRTAALSH